MDAAEPPPPSPSRFKPSSTSIFRDISNFKTPKRSSKISDFPHSPCPQFFTASKQTPRALSSFRRLLPPPPSSAARKLKAVELDQSQSSRKVQIQKEQSLKFLGKSLTVWLNFLFENPRSCGCNFPVDDEDHGLTRRKGKRDSGSSGVHVSVAGWRDPKRQRRESDSGSAVVAFTSTKYSRLRSSLRLLCSFDDLVQRMRLYLSLLSCQEVFDSMNQVTKSIDEGRLKMKVHCPIVTDVGLRKKAVQVLMSYNPIWLRIALYILFGGESLLSDRDVNSDDEVAFLKMIIEKQLFVHAGLAKEYAYNKKVEGLYRPGYYEALGNVVLKRFLLLVIILDRAKSQSCLPLKYGIDGVDGGSPLLFTVQSSIKSSQQVIHDFLSSDVMLGEGNVSAHLVILGYKVSHQQSPIVDFDFRVTDLFDDLQDGLRLCRAIQLLQDDSSILMKIAAPSDTYKKRMSNCGTALQYLKEAGVVLHDDGLMIVEDDIANGDKELTISLLWNMFVHLQLPLLVKKTTLADEICKIRGNMDSVLIADHPPMEILLSWIQAICENYDCKIDSFSALEDGKAIWCLLDYHFRKQLSCAWSSKEPHKSCHQESIMLASEYSDAVHNFLLSQKLMLLLGNFPEVLQISDILEFNGVPNDRSVVILLAFLSSQLIGKKNIDQLNFHKLLGCECQSSERISSVRHEPAQIQEEAQVQHTEGSVRNFKAIQAWWEDMAEKNRKLSKPSPSTVQNLCTTNDEINISTVTAEIRLRSVILIQQAARNWMIRRHQDKTTAAKRIRSVILIQQAARKWIMRRRQRRSTITHDVQNHDRVNAAIVVQRHTRGWLARSNCIHGDPLIHKSLSMFQENGALDVHTRAATKIQLAWNLYVCHNLQGKHLAAVKIQSHFRSWLLRRRFHLQRNAIIKVQSSLRMLKCRKAYQQYKIATESATIIQSYVRGWAARREASMRRHSIVTLQRHFRGWLRRRHFICQRKSVVRIQCTVRCLLDRQAFQRLRQAAVEIQRTVRGKISRSNLLVTAEIRLRSVILIQQAARNWMIRRHQDKTTAAKRIRSVILIQQAARKWIMRRRQRRSTITHDVQNHDRVNAAIVVQRHTRGWLARSNCIHGDPLIHKSLSMFQENGALDVHTRAATKIQLAWNLYVCHNLQGKYLAAVKIQSHFRSWLLRRRFHLQRNAIIKVQSSLRMLKCRKAYQQYKIATKSATIIQSYVREWAARREASMRRHIIITLQRYFRGWLRRRHFICQRKSAVRIQCTVRCLLDRQAFQRLRQAAVEIQRTVRGKISRSNLLGSSCLHPINPHGYLLKTGSALYGSFELNLVFCSVLKLQRWWRRVLSLKRRTKSAILIQSRIREHIARQKASRERHYSVVIQSNWRGYLARKKESREQLRDLRLRMKQSSTSVEDSMRIINRLLSALSELLRMKSISNILHTCATLDMATRYSQKCCERLVDAGAIKTLVKLINSGSRSIPDQEVLKHALSTLRNLARYPHLVEVLIDCEGSVETVFRELLRNKEEGYFIASELLKKICSTPKGAKAVRNSPAHLKRLRSLVDELSRKSCNEKRNARLTNARENTEKRRLKEAAVILKMAIEN